MGSPLVSRFREGFPDGFTAVTREGEPEGDTGIDFGVHRLAPGASVEEAHAKETAWVLLGGEAQVEWGGAEGDRAVAARRSLFDEPPTVLHVPAGTRVRLQALGPGSEWAVARAANPRGFAPRLFPPSEVGTEMRGAGLAQGACLRNVRLVFDDAVRPEANLVLGEVITYPGRWSSYPPHFHRQSEIYHYRFTEPQGWGHAELDDEVFKVRSHDTLKILGGRTHAQVAAPGYGMYYLWIVRHGEGDRYTGFTFTEPHRWLLDPARQGWEPKP